MYGTDLAWQVNPECTYMTARQGKHVTTTARQRPHLWMREPMSGEEARGAAESAFSSLGEEWWEEGGVCTFLGCTGMSWSSISMGKYDTLQSIAALISSPPYPLGQRSHQRWLTGGDRRNVHRLASTGDGTGTRTRYSGACPCEQQCDLQDKRQE